MDHRMDALLRLEPRPLDEILGELCALRARRETDAAVQVPRVTLHLRSGRDLSGEVLRLGDEVRTGRWLVLHDHGPDPRRVELDAVYLPLASIEAITVHGAGTLASEAAAPTRLELKRRLAQLGARLAAAGTAATAEVDWVATPEDDAARRALGELTAALEPALLAIGADALGRAALVDKVRRVVLAVGAGRAVTLADGALRVVVPLEGAPDRDELRGELERVL